MPKPTQPKIVLELESGGYLTPNGSIVPNVPLGTRVIAAAPGTSALLGAGAGAAPFGVPTKTLSDDPKSLWNTFAKNAKLSDGLKTALEQFADLVSAVSGAYSAYQFAITVLQFSGVIDAKTAVDPLVAATFSAVFADSAMTHKRDVATLDGNVIVAANAVKAYLQSPAPNMRADLIASDHDCQAACATLSLLPFFEVLFNPGEYTDSWIFGQGWLEIPSYLNGGAPPDPPVLAFADQPADKGRYEYRFTIASLSFALATRVAMMRLIEPEFRSTGRYRNEIQSLVDALGPIIRKWQQSIQWTWNPNDGGFPVSSFWPDNQASPYGEYIPVGAVDACSGTSAWMGIYVPPYDASASPDQPAFWTNDVVPYSDWPPKAKAKYLADAAALRASAREYVLDASGFKQFTAQAANLAVLATDPDSSETVTISPKKGIKAGRYLLPWQDKGPQDREFKSIACDSRTFKAEVSEGPAYLNLNITTQTPDSRNSFAILYRYYLAVSSGLVELHAGDGSASVSSPQFDAERGPNGENRNVKTGFGTFTIEYTLTADPGATGLALYLAIGSGNGSFLLRVDETIQSGRTFSTMYSFDLVTRELQLPSEYFAYVKDCEKRAGRMLADINQRYAKSTPRGPRFDPRRETVVDYLERLSRTAPEVVQAARANLPRQQG
jgi:hypothetical protein